MKRALLSFNISTLEIKDFSLIFILFFITNLTLGQSSTGWLSPNVTKANNSVANPDNVFASNNQRATWNNDNDYADYGDFNINIPAGATIDGIEVRVEGYNNGKFSWSCFCTQERNARIRLSWNNGSSFTNAKDVSLNTSERISTIGGSNDNWGYSPWTIGQLNNSNFRIKIEDDDGDRDMYIDHLQVNIHYTVPPVAQFSANNTSPYTSDIVTFTDLSTNNPASWAWSFSPNTVTYQGGTNASSQNPKVKFNNSGLYTVTLTATNAAGGDPEIKTNYINVISCGVSSFPYIQNFDSWSESPEPSGCSPDGSVPLFECWTNATGDNIDWDINAGATASSGTGPSGDHTSGGGKYLYTEASGNSSCNNAVGFVTSPFFDFSGVANPELNFWYHMNGNNMGSLSVQVSTNGGASWSGNIWNLSGDQPDSWQEASSISLLSYAGNPNVQLRFRGQTGNGFASDMAIDDVSVVDAPFPATLHVNTLNDFGDVCVGATGVPESFTISGSHLTTQNVSVSALTGFTYSTTSGGTYMPSLNLSQSGGTFNQIIYVKFNPLVAGSHDGIISVNGGGAPSVDVNATANGIVAPTAASSSFPLNNATDVCFAGGGAISSIAWDAVFGATTYDVYFGPGTLPTSVTQNVLGTSYNTIPLSANTIYKWKVVPKNSCGDAIGATTWSFTTSSAPCSDDYCDITFAEVRSITRVDFGTIDNYSSPLTGSPSYENYTSISTDLTAGTSETITLEGFTNGNNQFFYAVFFDWNQDGDFSDTGESYNIGTITNSTGVDGKQTSISIAIPTGAVSGTTTMRVIGSYNSYNADPCVAFSGEGQTEDYSVNIIPCVAGDPNVFGNNEWNVYAYNGDNLDLNGIIYAGYYTESSLTFNSQDKWGSNNSPSSASGYQGCPVADDNHTVVYKRTNFTCGIYQIDVTSHDDAARLYIDGVQVFEHIGCCDIHNNIWTGPLDANSTVEFRVEEQAGGSNGALTFTLIPTTADFSSDIQVVETGGVVNFTDESNGQIVSHSWTFTPSSVTFVGGTNSNSPNPQVQFNGLGSYNVDLTVTDSCGATFTKNNPNFVLVSNDMVFDTDGTFVVPCGITSIVVEAWGGGGAGGGSRSSGFLQTNSGAGGQGGAYATNTIAVTPGDLLTIDVASSVSGVNNGNGTNGHSSTILGYEAQIIAAGGTGGTRNATTNSPSGAGANGANGGGSGGSGVNPNSDGNPGATPGGGGSGSSTSSGFFGTNSRTGGNGASGRIILSWGLDAVPPVMNVQDIAVQLDVYGNASITANDIDNGSFDSCSSLTLILDITSFDCSKVGTNTVVLTATDAVGNASTATATVTVNDAVPAQVITQNISIDLDANGNASIVATDVDNGSNDACGIANMTVIPNSFTCSNVGANMVTLTVTDVNGNVSSETATVTINDLTPAQVITQDINIDLDDNGSVSIATSDVDNGSNDACGISSMTVAPNTFDCSNVGANTVTLMVTDVNGNVSSETATVTVNDVTPTQVITQDISIDLDANGNVSIVAGDVDNGSNDACGIASLSLVPNTFDCSNIGDNTVTLTVVDVNGNTNSATATVTVNDVTPAQVITQDISIDLDANGNVSIVAPDVDNGSNDACGIASLSVTPNTFDCFNIGANTVTLTVVDVNGNTNSATATVTVNDVSPAQVVSQDISVDLDASGTVSIVPADVDNGSNDACGIASMTVVPNIFDCSNVGANTVTLTVTDVNGNVSSETATVTVNDVTPAQVITQDISINLDANGNVSIVATDIDNGSNDACGIASLSVVPNTFDCSNVGANTVTLTVVDVNGNTNSATATVTVIDVTPAQVITQDISIDLDAYGNASIVAADVDNGSNDACGIASLSVVPNTFDCSNIGANTITLTVVDVNGNTNSATATVTVNDVTPAQVITHNISIDLDANGNVSIVAADVDNGSNDACGIASLSVAPNTFDCSNVGANTVTLTLVDVNGNTNSATATVTVNDVTPAQVITQDISIDLDSNGNASIVAADVNNGSIDACGIDSLSVAPNTFDCSNVGANTVTLTVVDVNGNTNSATASVTVNDVTPAQVITQNISIDLDANGNVSIVAADVDNGTNDACGIASMVVTPDTFDCSNIGANTVTLTVTDVNGNISSAIAMVTVSDNIIPDIVCIADATRDTDLGRCDYTIQGAEFDATFTDNCTSGTITNSINGTATLAGEVLVQGATTVTWIVDDGHGQTATCSTTITIEDNEAPIVDCLDIQVLLDASGNGSISIEDINNNSSDNCGIASITLSKTNFDCSDIGGDLDELIISEYSDGSGNNDCIEIFNGTGNPINLYAEGYTLRFYYNGNTTYTQVSLLGTVADRDVYVICNPFGPGASQAHQTGGFGFDGNDAIVLSKAGNAIDIIGEIGVDPGAGGWSAGGNSTAGTTLVRNKDVLYGNINDVTGIGSEWTQYAQNTTANLGTHEIEIADMANNVILTVTDTSGNVSICEGNVTVIDNMPPVALCQSVTVQLDANGLGSISASEVDNGSNDACGIASLVLDQTDFTCADVGDNTVTLTVTDTNGNTSSCDATITVKDSIDPIVITQDLIVQLNANGNASITPSQIDNGSNDNCGIATLTVIPETFDCSNVGVNTVVLTVMDTNGNVSSGTASVTVEDNTAPIAICQNITVELDINGEAIITGADVDNGSNDACGIASLEVFPSIFGCADIGANAVILTVTDNNGNVSTCNATVTVTGIIPVVTISQSPLPEFCQGAVLVLTAESDEDFAYLWTTGETTQSIEIPGNGTYGVTVTSLTNCSTEAEITITGFNAGALVSSYTIIASEKVELKNNVIVQSGGIGVTDSDGEIKVEKASHIVGLAQADEIEIKQGSSVGTAVYQPANPAIPAFVYNSYSNNTSPDVRINKNQTVTLTGGVYGKVEIEEGATVIFTASNVYINEIKTKKRATIEFDGCTNLLLNKEFELSENGVFNSNGHMVTMFIDDDFEVEKGSDFTGRVHTNDHKIKVEGHNSSTTYMTGLFIGKKVEADKNVIWNADAYCDPCPVEAPQNNGGSEPTSDYTIIGFDEVHLHGDNIVQTGGVGVTKHNKKIKLHKDSHITEFAKASKIQLNGGSSVGTLIHSPADPIIPLFVKNLYSNGSSPDATISNGQTVTLTGSVYDRVDVKEGATVIFTKSNVYINELKTHKYATIKFSGCTNVFLKKRFKLDDFGVINPEEHKVIFYVDDDVDIKKGSVVVASIYAYGDDIHVDGKSSDPVSMKGLFIAKKIHAHEDVLWNKDTSGIACPVVAPTGQIPVVPIIGNNSIEIMSVKAWPSPSDTVFNLRLTTENLSDRVTIDVFDMNNKLVHSNTFNPEEVYQFGNELEGGVYMVKVSQAGKNAYTRVIKF